MFYTIEKIDDHPCHDMQCILEVFFEQVIQNNVWDVANQHEVVRRIDGRSNFVSLLRTLYNEIFPRHVLVKQTIRQQFINNNNIENLCNNTLGLQENILWDISVGKKIKDFFLDCYPSKLDLGVFKREGCDLKPTKRFYQDFIEQNGHICPFCSILPHKDPFGKKRGDFDHYMDKAHYPMAALNLDNLIPMCSECNQDYKHTANILKNDDGLRREFIYPYSIEEAFELEVINMIFGDMEVGFDIEIITDIDNELKSSFDNVFHITERIERELVKCYHDWLSEEVKRYVAASGNVTVFGFKLFLSCTANYVIDLNNRTLQGTFLKYALFTFLANTDNHEINDIFLGSYLFEYIIQ